MQNTFFFSQNSIVGTTTTTTTTPSPDLNFTVLISVGGGVSYLGGSYDLVRVGGQVMETRNIDTGEFDDLHTFNPVSSGYSYYIDFGSIIAYNENDQQGPHSIVWGYVPGPESGTGTNTSPTNSSQNVSATVSSGLPIN